MKIPGKEERPGQLTLFPAQHPFVPLGNIICHNHQHQLSVSVGTCQACPFGVFHLPGHNDDLRLDTFLVWTNENQIRQFCQQGELFLSKTGAVGPATLCERLSAWVVYGREQHTSYTASTPEGCCCSAGPFQAGSSHPQDQGAGALGTDDSVFHR